jgi:hypothetical protein
MTTRAQLEEILAAQRAQRIHFSAQRKKRSMGLVNALAILVILIASGAAMFYAVQLTTPKNDFIATASPSNSLTPSTPTSRSLAMLANPVARIVCTDIPDGRLHVRFAAGDGSEVRGYLAEGETVQLALASTAELIHGERWSHISSPIAGWVNARYLCKPY